MKAKKYDRLITTTELSSPLNTRIPTGTEGTVVECYSTPTEGYAVDLRFKDENLVGGFSYENVILEPDQFKVVPEIT